MLAQGALGVEVRHAEGLFAENAEEAFHLVEPSSAEGTTTGGSGQNARSRTLAPHPRLARRGPCRRITSVLYRPITDSVGMKSILVINDNLMVARGDARPIS